MDAYLERFRPKKGVQNWPKKGPILDPFGMAPKRARACAGTFWTNLHSRPYELAILGSKNDPKMTQKWPFFGPKNGPIFGPPKMAIH